MDKAVRQFVTRQTNRREEEELQIANKTGHENKYTFGSRYF